MPKILFNDASLAIPLSPLGMGLLLLAECRKDAPDAQKALGLLHSGADTGIRDGRGFSALMWAVSKGHDAIADAIIATSELPKED
ncbi:MAG TPA: hypothetical protein VEF76_14020 [Patescibacteria group bacterium]|nr:hypothetical protein [Patescibacteria group bacterium]